MNLRHRSCWVTLQISTLRTSPRMEVPLPHRYYTTNKIYLALLEPSGLLSPLVTPFFSLFTIPFYFVHIFFFRLAKKYVFGTGPPYQFNGFYCDLYCLGCRSIFQLGFSQGLLKNWTEHSICPFPYGEGLKKNSLIHWNLVKIFSRT